jgi:hypothetical protein
MAVDGALRCSQKSLQHNAITVQPPETVKFRCKSFDSHNAESVSTDVRGISLTVAKVIKHLPQITGKV